MKVNNSEITSGFLFTHTRVNDNTQKNLQNSSFLYALIELLHEKGVITIEELDERKKTIAERLVKKFAESGLGLIYQDPEIDKYSFAKTTQVPCAEKISTCKAVCCRLPFALSRQDVEEGVVKWEFGRPYVIAHNEEGYCVHLNRETYECIIHDKRPLPCRGFDCRDRGKWKIWKDFDKDELDPDFENSLNAAIEKFYLHQTV